MTKYVKYFLPLLLLACQDITVNWTGIPDGARVCGWNREGTSGQCVQNGRMYFCVAEKSVSNRHTEYACVLQNQTAPVETP